MTHCGYYWQIKYSVCAALHFTIVTCAVEEFLTRICLNLWRFVREIKFTHSREYWYCGDTFVVKKVCMGIWDED